MSSENSHQHLLKTRNGYYYGTTKGRSWWRRYTKNGWFIRGNSELWVDKEGIHFRRYMTKEIKSILYKDIVGIELAKWHAGKWTGAPVIKILWNKRDVELVSGFSISTSKEETSRWIQVIKELHNKS